MPQGLQRAKTQDAVGCSHSLHSPLRPTPESIQVRAHLGSHPLPLTRKLLHRQHTHLLLHSVLQTRFHTRARTQTRILASDMRVHGHRRQTQRGMQLHTHTYHCTTPHSLKNKTRNITLCTKFSRSRTHINTCPPPFLFHTPSSSPPPLMMCGTLSPKS